MAAYVVRSDTSRRKKDRRRVKVVTRPHRQAVARLLNMTLAEMAQVPPYGNFNNPKLPRRKKKLSVREQAALAALV